MTLRIGVDATSWVNRRGYGRFARNALGRLVDLDADARYVFVVDEQTAPAAGFPGQADVLRVVVSRVPSEAASADSYRPPADLFRLATAVRRERFDAFLFPSLYTYFPVIGPPSLVGVHDLIADDFPELTLPTGRARAFWRLKQRVAARLAWRLFTVSETSRRQIAARWRIRADRLAIVPEAADPVFWPRSGAEAREHLRPLGIEPGEVFLLYAGGISPHKNVETLLAAYEEGHGAGAELPRLVITGDLEDDVYLSSGQSVRRRIETSGLEERVLLTGFVADDVLAALYSGAAAVCLPSLAEGFGLPAVEAAACGAPLVLSDIPAHRETMGDDALFFPPRDPAVLRERMRQLLASETLRRSLAERGRRRVSQYTWDASAEALRQLLHDAVHERSGRG
jgi:alpha-1,3-rhamnosyl/mannosyltransferase